MKKNTIESLYAYFVKNDNTVDLSTVVEDVRAEYERTNAKTKAKMDAYAVAKPIVLGVITDNPMTVKDIYEACKNDLPDDFSSHKIQYALRTYWVDDVDKHDNGKNPFTYSAK